MSQDIGRTGASVRCVCSIQIFYIAIVTVGFLLERQVGPIDLINASSINDGNYRKDSRYEEGSEMHDEGMG